jgi:hypothetical protein
MVTEHFQEKKVSLGSIGLGRIPVGPFGMSCHRPASEPVWDKPMLIGTDLGVVRSTKKSATRPRVIVVEWRFCLAEGRASAAISPKFNTNT